MNEPSERRAQSEAGAHDTRLTEDARPSRQPTWRARARQYRSDLEERPRIGFLLRSSRRYGQIEGKHLSLVIAMNLFVAIIPLLILGYAFLEAFNPHRSFGVVIVHAFHLTGDTARTVEDTFTTANSGKSTALSISIISLLITGFDISATVQLAYARAFAVTPLTGLHKYLRGAAWLIVLLAVSGWWPDTSLPGRRPATLGPPHRHPRLSPAAIRILHRDSPPASRLALRVAGSGTRGSGQHRRRGAD